MMNRRIFIVWVVVTYLIFDISLGMVTQGWSAAPGDHSIYGLLLEKYVKDGLVDYSGFTREEEKLNQYLKLLEKTDFQGLALNEEFAFYINAYNAWTIKLVLGGYPKIKSIKDLGSFFAGPWEKRICRIDGKIMSLDEIEHKILRPRFRDPRVHFAINCAAKGCPPLASYPYRGVVLDKQPDSVTRTFINNPERNYINGHTLYLSKIFKWFAKDFSEGMIGSVMKHAGSRLKKGMESMEGQFVIRYLDYDWSLNKVMDE